MSGDHLVPTPGVDVNGHAYVRNKNPDKGVAAGALGGRLSAPAPPTPVGGDAEEARLNEAQDPFESHEDRVAGAARDLIFYMDIPGDEDADPGAYLAGLGWRMPAEDDRDVEEAVTEVMHEVQSSDGLPFRNEQWTKVAEGVVSEGAYLDLASLRERLAQTGLRESFVQSYASTQVDLGFAIGSEGEVEQTLHASDWDSAAGVLSSFDSDGAAALRDDAEKFVDANASDLAAYAHFLLHQETASSEQEAFERAAGDFALTRNGHGAGFWDRGMGDLGHRLAADATAWGGQQVVAGGGKLSIV